MVTNIAIEELERLICIFSKKYGRQLGDGLTAACFLDGDKVKKVYGRMIPKWEIFKEAYIMSCIERAGIHTSKALGVGNEEGYWVLEMTYLPGKSLLEAVNTLLQEGKTEEADRMIARMALEQANINKKEAKGLPSYKAYARTVILENSHLSKTQREKLIAYLDSLPEGENICHGDLHPNNYLLDEEGNLTPIDWPEVGAGVPACDAARTYLNMCHPAWIMKTGTPLSTTFMEEYCKNMGIGWEEIAKWLPIHAGMLVGYKKPDFSEVVAQYLL